MAIEDQVAYCESLRDQLLALWIKIDGKYAQWNESTVHLILHNAKITSDLKNSFDDYTKSELSRAIGRLKIVLANYKSVWEKAWNKKREEHDAATREIARLREECYTWSDVEEWLRSHDTIAKAPEIFEFVKRIRNISFYQLRTKRLTLYTERKARALCEQFNRAGDFNLLFEPCVIDGFDGTYFKPLYEVRVDNDQ